MIAIGANYREFPDDERYESLRIRESQRLALLREQYVLEIREEFLRSLRPKIQKPTYPDHIGDFRKDKDPVNFALRSLYSEEV